MPAATPVGQTCPDAAFSVWWQLFRKPWRRSTKSAGPVPGEQTAVSPAAPLATFFCVFFFFTGRTHRLIVLFFGIADVSPDFFIHSKHQLLGRRQDSDRVWSLRNTKISLADVFTFKRSEDHNGDDLPFASRALDFLVHIPAHGHQHHGVIRRMLPNKQDVISPRNVLIMCVKPLCKV